MGKTTKSWPIIFFIFIWFVFSWPFFLKGLIPAPLDFLVNFYNPWQAYHSLPIKNPGIPDVVSQIIPWKIYTINSLKSGTIPLWNPYNFSGTPHFANFQSASFSIFNFLFFIFSFKIAWSLFILFQPLLADIFTYLYCSKLRLSSKASLLAAISFSFGGFLTVWLEYGTLGWAILWLPLLFYFWECFLENKKIIFLVLISITITFSLFSGHLQISLYLIFAYLLYLLFSWWQRKINLKLLLISLFPLFFSFLLAAVQLLPSLDFYLNSHRSQQIPVKWYKGLQIPWYYLLTLVFPDFFGHPVTRNQWVEASYVEMMAYGGWLTVLMVSFYIIIKIKNKKINRDDKSLFFLALFFLSLLLALPTPLSNLILWLKIPVLASSAPSRIICVTGFALAILGGLAWENFYKALIIKNKLIIKFLFTILALFLILLPLTYLTNKIAFRNIIFSFVGYLIFISITFLFFFKNKKSLLDKSGKKLFFYFLIFLFLLVADLFRFWHKFNPFTSAEGWYPNLELIRFLQQNTQDERVYGILEDNLNLPFRIFSTTGYDSLNLINYQEFIKASDKGISALSERTTGENIAARGKYSKNILEMLGVKYFVIGKSDVFAFPVWDYLEDFKLVWEDKKYFIFENLNRWPRYFLTNKYEVVRPEDFLIKTLSAEKNKIILLKEPEITYKKTEWFQEIKPYYYKPGEIMFKITNNEESLLFLSESFEEGWRAYLNNQRVAILKANYAFRAIKLPAGHHEVKFIYQPESFNYGLKTSLFSFSLMIILLIVFRKRALNNLVG